MIGAALVSLTLLASSPGPCLTIAGSEILARDLAAGNTLLAAMNPDAVFGFAPMPGASRVLQGRELAAFARRNGIAVENAPLADLCVERQTAPLRPADIREAIEKAAGIPDARIELLDYSRQPMPGGELEFRWNTLGVPIGGNPDIPVVWRGRLNYDAQHSLTIWAKVRISVERPVVTAAADLLPGRSIELQQLQITRARVFPSSIGFVDSPEAVQGKVVSRLIRAGQPVPASVLRKPDDVTAGEKVQVRVVDGSANVSFEGTALGGGRKGTTIPVRNPASGRVFRGVIEDKARVVVRSGGPA